MGVYCPKPKENTAFQRACRDLEREILNAFFWVLSRNDFREKKICLTIELRGTKTLTYEINFGLDRWNQAMVGADHHCKLR